MGFFENFGLYPDWNEQQRRNYFDNPELIKEIINSFGGGGMGIIKNIPRQEIGNFISKLTQRNEPMARINDPSFIINKPPLGTIEEKLQSMMPGRAERNVKLNRIFDPIQGANLSIKRAQGLLDLHSQRLHEGMFKFNTLNPFENPIEHAIAERQVNRSKELIDHYTNLLKQYEK